MAVLLFGCSLDRIKLLDFSEYLFRKPNFETLLASKNTKEEFMITSDNDSNVFTKNQNFIYINKNILQTKDGQAVEYPYVITYEEFLTPKDYILNNLPTTSENRILETAGAFRIEVFKNGEELTLKPGRQFQFIVQNKIVLDQEMSLFQGNEVDSVDTDFDWIINTNPEAIGSGVNPEGGNDPFYYLFPSSLGFINIDKFLDYEGKVTENFTFSSEEPPLENIRVFLFFRSINSIMEIERSKKFPLPIGEKVRVIAISVNQNDEYFSYFEDITIIDGFKVDIALRPTSNIDLQRMLDELEFPNQN